MGEEDPNPREKENGMGGINVLNDLPCTYDCVLSFIFCMSFQRLHFFFFSCVFLTVFGYQRAKFGSYYRGCNQAVTYIMRFLAYFVEKKMFHGEIGLMMEEYGVNKGYYGGNSVIKWKISEA